MVFQKRVKVEQLSTRREFDRAQLQTNLMFGTPDVVIDKLQAYQALGVDHYIYNASYGLDMSSQKQSLQLFIDEVMPGSSVAKTLHPRIIQNNLKHTYKATEFVRERNSVA
ncbi:MAG: hypothetical protein CM1200mP18_23100 [Gammaproteobacteria bacterium]|nr:MAG: hypothetical protein CM1200mP18_23100 [Gammaproteobacteria bacterium]